MTVLHCEIEEFHSLVKFYGQGEGLFEVLEQLQSVIDVLCEQFGLAKVEQVGNHFTICGGLKQQDAIDHRLQNTHHSVRVVDFAIALQNFARSKVLINNRRLTIKFGIH